MVDIHIKEVAKNVKAYLDTGTPLEDLKTGFITNGGTEEEWEEVLIQIQRQGASPFKKLAQKIRNAKAIAKQKVAEKQRERQTKKQREEKARAQMTPEQKKALKETAFLQLLIVICVVALVGIRLTLPLFFLSPAEIAAIEAEQKAQEPKKPVIPTLSINPDELDIRPLIELSMALEEEKNNKSDELLHFLEYLLTRPAEIKTLDRLRVYAIKIPLGLRQDQSLYSNDQAIKDFKKMLATVQREALTFGPTFAETVLQKSLDNYKNYQNLDPTPRFTILSEMIEDYSKALKKDPMTYQLLLGELYLLSDKPQTAKEILLKAQEQASAKDNYDKILDLTDAIGTETKDYLELSATYVNLLLECKTMYAQRPENEKCSAKHLLRIATFYETQSEFKGAFCGPKPYITETESQQIFNFCRDHLAKPSQRKVLGTEDVKLATESE